MPLELIPSILVESQKEFEQRLRLVENNVQTIHVDILDGTLFPFTNWHDAETVAGMQTSVRYELHLMVSNPLPIIAEWVKYVPQTCRAIVHAEIERPLNKILEQIRTVHCVEAGVALNPETPLEEIQTILKELDTLLVMGVHPGASGQVFEGEYILEKIRQAHERIPELPITIDGGVTLKNMSALVDAGCSRFCVTSIVFGAKNPHEALQAFQTALAGETPPQAA
ncbi:MAG: ribulose-phosphate 3-epimerase [Candidatus Uhrbacteria bacterium GW2011_GWF2_41_16]|jgi:ribulose-phosphate 3-epimerase|uniref:Ribulose-phosphate 3-epimerase n=2 Tax=Candidatus Uhriibacteriota TaxID=1752732 RepID=A0A0G0V9B7_9BACT|nr:MAG: ribulose-phosphate 3-epimerase [Candidatus Uhrbacteria bacterium GW2011_GWA2_41_10]KKR86215.1 MAG: ribulose-phosphate 3-epimerase [Candidatus Uhrbacteria bacterium GW2011_GWC2_41_11]KKR97569.1 MAG: ribulose-phosphate 3-epimerase [Candidatus Uhrbacteria bacterium GW2011_GWF2_41_16]